MTAGAVGAGSATVTVTQAITADTAVDVLLDGRICALRNVAYAETGVRLALPPGPHTLAVLPADGTCTGGAPLAGSTLEPTSGADLAVAARPTDTGAALTVLATDLAATTALRARVRLVNQSASATADVALVRQGSGDPRLDAIALPAGESSVATLLVKGTYDVTVRTDWGVFTDVLDVEQGRVVDLYLTGSGTADQRLVADVQLASLSG